VGKKTPLRAVDDLIAPAVAMQIQALGCGDEDAGFVAAALLLARTIDGMDDDVSGWRRTRSAHC
jgi:hypothetical protein